MKLRRKTINHQLLIHRYQNLHRYCQYETKNTSFIVIFVLISFRLDSLDKIQYFGYFLIKNQVSINSVYVSIYKILCPQIFTILLL